MGTFKVLDLPLNNPIRWWGEKTVTTSKSTLHHHYILRSSVYDKVVISVVNQKLRGGGGIVMALPVKIYGAKFNYLHTTREMQYRRETHEYCKFGERHQIFCSEWEETRHRLRHTLPNGTLLYLVLLSGRHRPDTLVIQATTSRQRSDDLSGA